MNVLSVIGGRECEPARARTCVCVCVCEQASECVSECVCVCVCVCVLCHCKSHNITKAQTMNRNKIHHQIRKQVYTYHWNQTQEID